MITDYLNIRQAAAWYLRPCLGTCGKVFILMSFKIRGEMNTIIMNPSWITFVFVPKQM